MSVWTDWDPLEEVIVGNCYAPGALNWFVEPALQDEFNNILAETKQDLDALAALLSEMGVQVHRPRVHEYQHSVGLATFSVPCPTGPMVPRDQYLVYGDTVYQTYTSMNDRYFDSLGYYNIFQRMFDQGHNWISQPPPNLRNLPPEKNWSNQGSLIYNHLYHNQLLWHTATMFKCGNRLITNTTGPGSQSGLEWMRRNLPTHTVIENTGTTMRNWGHIDHGFFMINDDTVICVDREFVPECLRDKTLHEVYQYLPKQIMAPDTPIDSLLDPSKGYEQVVVFDTNVLVVDAHNVIFDNNMPELFEFLAGIGITSHVSAVRHRKFWASGIHCMTLDIRRRGKKRKIVNEI
jgi:glycine amidinotransferase